MNRKANLASNFLAGFTGIRALFCKVKYQHMTSLNKGSSSKHRVSFEYTMLCYLPCKAMLPERSHLEPRHCEVWWPLSPSFRPGIHLLLNEHFHVQSNMTPTRDLPHCRHGLLSLCQQTLRLSYTIAAKEQM